VNRYGGAAGQVLAPYDAEDARGLLKAAIRDPDPIVFLENEILYGESFPVSDKVLDPDFVVPIGKAKARRPLHADLAQAWPVLSSLAAMGLLACALSVASHAARSEHSYWALGCCLAGQACALCAHGGIVQLSPRGASWSGRSAVVAEGAGGGGQGGAARADGGAAQVMREGTDVTLVSFGKLVAYDLQVAEKLEKEGISVEARALPIPYIYPIYTLEQKR